MKFCTKCGAKAEDDSLFCGVCGAQLSAQSVEDAPVSRPSFGSTNSATVPSVMTSSEVEAARAAMSIPEDEEPKVSIGNTFLGSIASGSGIRESVAVATDKRLYYHGRTLIDGKDKLSNKVEDGSVLLKDISYTGMQSVKSIKVFILAAIVVALEVIFVIMGGVTSSDPYSPFVVIVPLYSVVMVIALAAIAVYYFTIGKRKAKTAFVVKFPGGGITFNVQWYPQKECDVFRNILTQLVSKAKG